ncbi:hypothetical protein C8R45DRAFT_1069629 [Mycena sanguinolenta]|nr:hypothetical protein C8R45DRAFT_1069629 [Mycena sanguinolenta]
MPGLFSRSLGTEYAQNPNPISASGNPAIPRVIANLNTLPPGQIGRECLSKDSVYSTRCLQASGKPNHHSIATGFPDPIILYMKTQLDRKPHVTAECRDVAAGSHGARRRARVRRSTMVPWANRSITIKNYIRGGRGGSGGENDGNGTGGAGGHEMGPTVRFEISADKLYHTSGRSLSFSLCGIGTNHDDERESFPQPKCHPETREKMLQDLHEWVLDRETQDYILWLYGPAGAGKSAIMQTLAGQLQADRRLGGSFVFKRGHRTRGNANTLFATIAYQLALNIPSRNQCTRGPRTILIDGLDECEGSAIQAKILRAIRICGSQSPIPLGFIVASRPEPHIHDAFDSSFYLGQYRAFSVEQSFHDVRNYLCDEFSRIHREHGTMTSIPLPWPSPDILDELVQNSSGHFIYAATIIKFIDDKYYRPTERLAVVRDGKRTRVKSAFDALDQLYAIILSAAPRSSQLLPILCALANFELNAGTIDEVFGFEAGNTRLLLRAPNPVKRHHSQNSCISTLPCRMDLARSLLRCSAGDVKEPSTNALLTRTLIPFITSLPPSAELCPLIELMNPEYIVYIQSYLESMRSWFKEITPAPRQLITLWEEYGHMVALEKIIATTSLATPMSPEQIQVVSQSPEILRVLVVMAFLDYSLRNTLVLLGIPWNELRTTICRLITIRGEPVPIHLVASIPFKVYLWASRDLALSCIVSMVEEYDKTNGPQSNKLVDRPDA